MASLQVIVSYAVQYCRSFYKTPNLSAFCMADSPRKGAVSFGYYQRHARCGMAAGTTDRAVLVVVETGVEQVGMEW
eukprot:COSAG01_NODE_6840_length_3476_cov_3.076103_2_plen_76_part_00